MHRMMMLYKNTGNHADSLQKAVNLP